MPRFDGTGPFGAGPGSGWGMGPCGGGMRRGVGRYGGWGTGRGGWGRGRWGGRGFGPRYFGPFGYGGAADEAQALQEEAAYLKSQLDAIQQRLSELESSQT